MSLPNLLVNAVRIFLKTRRIWLFAAVYAVYSIITLGMPSSSSTISPEASLRLLPLICGVECLMLLMLPVMLFSSCGTAYAAGQVASGQPVTLRGAWERFKQRGLAVFLLTLAFVVVVMVLVFIMMALLIGGSLAGWLSSSSTQGLTIVAMMALIMPLSLIIALGYVALMLDPQSDGFNAIVLGAKIFWRKAGLVLLAFLLYFVIFAAAQVIFSFLFYAVFDRQVLQTLPVTDFSGLFIRFMGSTPSKLLNIVLMPIAAPIYFIMLALIYQSAARPQQAAPVSAVEPA